MCELFVHDCKADYWGDGRMVNLRIKKIPEGIFANARKVIAMTFNGIQLRFQMDKNPNRDIYIIFDGRSESDLTIEEMYDKLK